MIPLFSYSPCPIVQQVLWPLPPQDTPTSTPLLLHCQHPNQTPEHLLPESLQYPWNWRSCFQSSYSPFAIRQPEDLSKNINLIKSLSYVNTFQWFSISLWINFKILVLPHGALPDLTSSHAAFTLTPHSGRTSLPSDLTPTKWASAQERLNMLPTLRNILPLSFPGWYLLAISWRATSSEKPSLTTSLKEPQSATITALNFNSLRSTYYCLVVSCLCICCFIVFNSSL